MNREIIEQKYKQNGLVIEYVNDKPGKVYEPHCHEQTHVFTLAGSVEITLDGTDTHILKPNQEFIVGDNQQHSALVGPEGWECVAAWDGEEAKKYQHED